ncbi:ABC transporter permease [Micromonospora okii]|uniref:ABC transporter permease n=1 Tax=Micromonospora okii TaxID=1182970 RepID=UPI001E366125|nr:ABC transporter permease [Micromonospora okii]
MTDRLLTAAWVVWTALRAEQRGMRTRPTVVVVSVVQPVALLAVVAGTRSLTPDRTSVVVSAVVLTAMWSATVWTAGGVLRRERSYGTLARSVTSQFSPSLVLFGRSLGATLYSVACILASSAAVIVLLRLRVAVPHPLWLLAALLVVLASGTALGMLLSCLFLVTRHGLAWSSALIYPVFILGGLLIPPDALPEWLRWVPALLSLHWVHEFVVGLSSGAVRATPLAVAVALTMAYLVAAVGCLRAAVDAGRRRGTLELV